MGRIPKGALCAKGIICLFAIGATCSSASASSIYMIPPSALALAAASLPAGSHCLYLTYDKNGNRLSRSTSAIAMTSPAWGASIYGCSRWGALP
jgi:hypothetical protein